MLLREMEELMKVIIPALGKVQPLCHLKRHKDSEVIIPALGKVQRQTHRFLSPSYQKPAHLSIYPAILFQKVKNTPKRFAPPRTKDGDPQGASVFSVCLCRTPSLAEFRQDAGINSDLKKVAACTSLFSHLRRVSVRAKRVHAPGCNLSKMLAFC